MFCCWAHAELCAFAVRPHLDLPKSFLLWFMRKLFAQTLVGSVLLIHQHRRCVRKQTLLSFFQMSKSTGNFLTLTQAVDKFSADGECILTCIWLSIMPERLKWVFCSLRSLLEYWMAINLPLTTCSCWKAEPHLEGWDVWAHLDWPGAAPGAEPCRSRAACWTFLHAQRDQNPGHTAGVHGVCSCLCPVCPWVPCSCHAPVFWAVTVLLSWCWCLSGPFPRRAVLLS